MSAPTTIKFRVANTSALAAALAELSALLEEAEAKLPVGLFDRFLQAIYKIPDRGAQLVRIGPDEAAAAVAGELSLLLQPSDTFLHLLAALRARQIDVEVVEGLVAHLQSPSALDAPMVTESPAGQKPAGDEDGGS